MVNKYCFFVWLVLLTWSCQNENLTPEVSNLPKVDLTYEEYISIAFDSPRTLSESEAMELVQNFDGSGDLSRGEERTFSIKRKYSLGSTDGTLSRGDNNRQCVPVYEITMNEGNDTGLAIVAADERVAGVVAFIPKIIPDKEVEQRENNFMLKLSELSVLHRLAFVDSIRMTKRDSTMSKVSEKLGIPVNEINFEQIKEQINIKNEGNGLSRAKPLPNLPPPSTVGTQNTAFLKVDWGQDEPYNLLLPTYPDPNYDWVTYHYPLGCSVTALMMVYSYFEPSMKGYDNGQEMIIDWAYLKENRKIINPDYGVPGDPERKLRMISRLGFWIYNGTKTQTTYKNGVYQSGTSRNEIADDLDTYKIAHDPIKSLNKSKWRDLEILMDDVKEYRIAIMGATRLNAGKDTPTATGNHVWVLDGYGRQAIFEGTTVHVYDYLHANMGWNGSYNGWYCIDTSLSFETGNGDYDTDYWYISKLRKK